MGFSYLTVEEVVELHDMLVDLYGGLQGREHGKLESKLALPMSGFGDFERFPTIEEKAAAYHYYLASGHAFNDGNKRTSYAAAFIFLDFNGYDLVADDEDVFQWTLLLADDKTRPAFEEAVNWMAARIKKREE
ncbi:type II toxin-antitoxin system death-on-curing family toxin [Metabacillus sp. FJAT-52054]|uniref:Type II toxin-antitoxin system death-on-curing family toxin n=1 Tax=Metabacillus sediminis TaxID=3117746 RepID=A0ABZ2NJM2_9BACI